MEFPGSRLDIVSQRIYWVLVIAATLPLLAFESAIAQQQAALRQPAVDSLPDAPQPQHIDGVANDQASGSPQERAGGVSGTVQDSTGAAIAGAQVSISEGDGRRLQTVKSGALGEFTFDGLTAGSYVVIIEAVGFAPFKTQEFPLTARELYSLPPIALSVAGATTEVFVRPTEEIAAEQIKAEEKQRLVGVFPNFYVSYVPDAAPLTSKQKLSLATHDSLDWTRFIGVSVGASVQQATNAFEGYGQGAQGYGKRWGALFANGRISDFLGHYVYASAFHQDPRYFYQGTGTKKSRLYHALSYAFIARSDSGKTMPNYSYLLSDLTAAAISNAYYPSSDRGAGLVFTNAGLGLVGRMVQGLAQEFIGKRLTKNVPAPSSPGTSGSTAEGKTADAPQ